MQTRRKNEATINLRLIEVVLFQTELIWFKDDNTFKEIDLSRWQPVWSNCFFPLVSCEWEMKKQPDLTATARIYEYLRSSWNEIEFLEKQKSCMLLIWMRNYLSNRYKIGSKNVLRYIWQLFVQIIKKLCRPEAYNELSPVLFEIWCLFWNNQNQVNFTFQRKSNYLVCQFSWLMLLNRVRA